MKNVLKNRWFTHTLVAFVFAVGGFYVSNNEDKKSLSGKFPGTKAEEAGVTKAEEAGDTIPENTVYSMIGNYGFWAGSISKHVKNNIHHDGTIEHNQFVSFWTIDMKDIDSIRANCGDASSIHAYLAFRTADIVSIPDTANDEQLLINIGLAMSKAHLVITPVLPVAGTKKYYDLIEPCPTLCDTANSVLYPIYRQAFDSGYTHTTQTIN